MNSYAMMQAGDQKLKAYWNRPGGKVKTVVALGGFAVLAMWAFPMLTAVIWNTINVGIACVAALLFLFLVTNKPLRLRLQAVWDILMKYTVGLIFEWDPFVLAEDQIKDMVKQREKINDLLANDIGLEKERLEGTLKEKQKDLTKQKSIVTTGSGKKGYEDQVANASAQAGRLNSFIQSLMPIYDNLCKTYNYLDMIYKKSAFMIDDAKNALDLQKQLYRSVTAGSKALGAAQRFFNGDPEKQLMVEQSLDLLKTDIAGKVSNMKRAISCTSEYMKSIDLENASAQHEGLEFLKTFDEDNTWKQMEKMKIQGTQSIIAGEVPSTDVYDSLLK